MLEDLKSKVDKKLENFFKDSQVQKDRNKIEEELAKVLERERVRSSLEYQNIKGETARSPL